MSSMAIYVIYLLSNLIRCIDEVNKEQINISPDSCYVGEQLQRQLFAAAPYWQSGFAAVLSDWSAAFSAAAARFEPAINT